MSLKGLLRNDVARKNRNNLLHDDYDSRQPISLIAIDSAMNWRMRPGLALRA